MKILLVEDNIKHYLSIKKFIEDQELGEVLMHNEAIVDNYDKAISIIRTENPNFAILDLELQNSKSGVDIAKYLYKMNIPFIILTAYDTPENIEKLKKLNPIAFHFKIDLTNDFRQLKNTFHLYLKEIFSIDKEKVSLKMKKILKPKDSKNELLKANNKYGDEYDYKPIHIEDVKYFTKSPNNKNYCILIIDYNSDECYEIPFNLKTVETNLPKQFVRINAETIININEIDSFLDRPYTIHLKGKKYLSVSETYKADVTLILANHFPFLVKS